MKRYFIDIVNWGISGVKHYETLGLGFGERIVIEVF